MPATELEMRAARTRALSDQAWATFARDLPAIERISRGEIVPSDAMLIQGIACLVAGDMYLRRAESREAE